MAKKAVLPGLFDKAVEEVSQSGELSFPTRRRLWLALGKWEWRDEDDREESPRALTEPLKKRAGLACACAKKVMPIWSAYAPAACLAAIAWSGRDEEDQPWRERFTGLTRREAERLQTVLRSHGIKCRILPWRVGVPGDTQLR